MNIACVKWGSKYSADYVNKLYSMLKRHYPVEFNFYCYTDDPFSLHQGINPIIIDSDLTGWWLKLDLLDKLNTGPCIVFDLDVVLLNQLNILHSVKTRTVSILYSQWKEGYVTPSIKDKFPTLYNSSIIKWEGNQGSEIYNYFRKHQDRILFKYTGIDRFLFHEPVVVDLLPTSIAYSYWRGARFKKDTARAALRDSYEVCIFNEGIKMHEVKGWVHDYWY